MTPQRIRPEDLDLAALIRPGDVVACSQGTAEPLTLTRRLVEQADAIGPIGCFIGATYSDSFPAEAAPTIRFQSYGAIGTAGRLAKAGRLSVLPWHYSQVDRAFATGALKADVVLLGLAGPGSDQPGYSTSVSNDFAAQAARHARLVIAEVNARLPWTYGSGLPEGVVPHLCIETDRPAQELAPARFGDVEARIAAHAASCIPDGACLQFGLGAIPTAILSALGQHRDLGIHSGVIIDGCVDLIERGVITNARKRDARGITVTNTVLGTERLFRFVHRNPQVEVRPAAQTHAHAMIAAQPSMRALNSAIEVDITGQVNAEIAGGAYVGAVGGQLDFVRGALASEGGRAILGLPATALGGKQSRIVAGVQTVSAPRSDTDLVVTEHGVADLRGQDLDERARRMIAIAAPEFREDLARAWRDGVRPARAIVHD